MKKKRCIWLSPEKCCGCGRCVSVCPKGLLSMSQTVGAHPVAQILRPERCAACGSCELVCKCGAIEVYGR